MIVFTTQQSNRLLYVLQFVFTQFSNVTYRVTENEEEFINYSGAKINYSDGSLCKDEVHIVPSHFLNETSFKPFIPEVDTSNKIPVLFPSKNNFPNAYYFDVFSAIFYMLSRYEEYSSKAKDQYGRFPAKESLAYKHNFLQFPVVDIWLTELVKQLRFHHSPFTIHKKTTVSFTYDIDVAFAYKGREIARQAGSAIKDVIRIDPYNLAQRTAVLAGYLEDPFDTYHYIQHESIHPVIFFLISDRKTKYDHNLNPKNKALQTLIKEVSHWAPVGIHPSFYSSDKPEKIRTEKKALESITSHSITKSRQHYLKFKVPHTYRELAKNGITEDYSMAFAEVPGFRAGTCTPFYLFDVEKNEPMNIKLFPAAIMESTFRDDIIVPVQEALPFFIQYFEEVNKVNGHFISIWHNDTLAAKNPKTFRWLHQQILQYIRSRIKD